MNTFILPFESLIGFVLWIIAIVYLLIYANKQYNASLEKYKIPFKRKYNCKKDHPDSRDNKFILHDNIILTLPTSVDLRAKMPPVVDQEDFGSSTANAIASGLKEYLVLKNDDALIRLSRLFLYYFERELEGAVEADSGIELRNGMKILQKIGVCPDFYWPYVIQILDRQPNKKAIESAAQYKISAYHRIKDLVELKAALAEDSPVVFSFAVYESFESARVAETGILPMPAEDEKLLGGHAVLAVGYDDDKKWVVLRNSWGEAWGDKGYFYMPYEVFNKLVMDMWTGK